MTSGVRKPRRVCRIRQISRSVTPSSPKKPKTIVDTPRRTRLLLDASRTAGKLPRKELFKAHGIAVRTGYRILQEKTTRRSTKLHDRGRKPVITPDECRMIEAVEDSDFRFATSKHVTVARSIGIENGSERAIQRNMTKYGVQTNRAAQRKWLPKEAIQQRHWLATERRFWPLEHFQQYIYSDESHFACRLARQAMVHRRRGREAREAPTKMQWTFKRENQVWHVFGFIGWNFKGPLHFYEGTGAKGRMIQKDYIKILEKIVAPHWQADWILLEDNDNAHGTRAKGDNEVKRTKRRLGITCESNTPHSPDLNPIEKIWRMIKQRLKNRGVIFNKKDLRKSIEEEWDRITLEEINTVIAAMPQRMEALYKACGGAIPDIQ